MELRVESVVTQSKSFSSVPQVFYLTGRARNIFSLLDTFEVLREGTLKI